MYIVLNNQEYINQTGFNVFYVFFRHLGYKLDTCCVFIYLLYIYLLVLFKK